MTRATVLLSLIALTFAAAEVVRPTRFIPKKIAARALVVHSQSVPGGATDSLDPNLLDGLPRIHPDALGTVRLSERGDGSFGLTGTLADPIDGITGAGVFLESDGARIGGVRTSYGAAPQPHDFSMIVAPAALGRGSHRLFVALISADARGFFLLPHPVLVRVAR